MQEVKETDKRFVFVDTDSTCASNVSKVLLVYDQHSVHYKSMVHFLTSHLGYHVISLLVDDSKFSGMGDFTRALDGAIPRTERNREYVFYVFQFSSTSSTACMYCDRDKIDSSRLLKSALATCYVRYGTSRCVIVHPEPCCAMDDTLLPAAQLEDKHISFRVGSALDYMDYCCCNEHCGDNETVRTMLAQKIRTVRDIDARRDVTRHVLTVQSIEREKVEQPLTQDEVLRLLGTILQRDPRQTIEIVAALGVNTVEWEPHYARFQGEALYLVIKRAVRTQTLEAVCVILEPLVDKELVEGLRASGTDDDWYLSEHPSWQQHTPIQEETASARPNPSESTHIGQVNARFLPPYLRDQMEKLRTVTDVTLGDDPEKGIKLLQDMDKEYEKKKLERELLEYHGKVPSGTTLMSGYSMRDPVYTEKAKQ